MRILGYLLVTIGILFGLYLLIVVSALTTFPSELKGEKTSYMIGYHFGTVVAIIFLVVLDFLVIRFGCRCIRKAKITKQGSVS